MFKRIGKVVKPLIDFRPWLGTQTIHRDSKQIGDAIKTLYQSRKPKNRETFEEAYRRMGLTEATLHERKTTFLRFARFFVLCAAITFAYTIFLCMQHSWHAVFLSLVITLFLFSMSFRYHFWWYQMTSRKLGCSLTEWLKKGLLKQ